MTAPVSDAEALAALRKEVDDALVSHGRYWMMTAHDISKFRPIDEADISLEAGWAIKDRIYALVDRAYALGREATESDREDVPAMAAPTEGRPVVFLPFSAYELANLAEALESTFAVGGHATSPLHALNTGDWTAVTQQRFRDAQRRYAPHEKPNQTAEEMRRWAIFRCGELTALGRDATEGR